MLKSKLLFVLLVCMAISCSDPLGNSKVPGTENISVVDNRLVFSTEDSYRNALDELSKMTPDKRFEWSKQFSFRSLESSVMDMENPYEFMAKNGWDALNPTHSFVLNDKGLVQIGNGVFLYQGGKKYRVEVTAYDKDKSAITRSTDVRSYGWQNGSTPTEDNARPITAPNNALHDGTYGCGGTQHEFQLPDGSWRKWIYVFRGSYEEFGPEGACGGTSATLKLWLCMEQYGRTKTSKPWSNCPDHRSLSWSVNLTNVNGRYAAQCNTAVTLRPVTTLTNLSGSYADANFHYFGIEVASYGQIVDPYNTKTFQWTADCTGTMTQTYPWGHTYTENFNNYYPCP